MSAPKKFYERSKIPERNRVPQKKMSRSELAQFIESRGWYQTFDFGRGLVVSGAHVSEEMIDRVLPENMTGMRYLDIGSNQGFQVLSASMRGADAFGIDNEEKQVETARILAAHFGIRAQFDVMDIFASHLKYAEYPKGFDYISHMSMFHHLRYPRLALQIMRRMCRGVLMSEFCCWVDGEKRWIKVDRFPGDLGKLYHKGYPTVECCVAELEKLFKKVEVIGPLKARHRILIRSEV